MAVFWRGPVKATLETSPFPSGKLEEKENTARVFQVGNVETLPGQLATLIECLKACLRACGKAWSACQMRLKPACKAQAWPPESRDVGMRHKGCHHGHFFSLEETPEGEVDRVLQVLKPHSAPSWFSSS